MKNENRLLELTLDRVAKYQPKASVKGNESISNSIKYDIVKYDLLRELKAIIERDSSYDTAARQSNELRFSESLNALNRFIYHDLPIPKDLLCRVLRFRSFYTIGPRDKGGV